VSLPPDRLDRETLVGAVRRVLGDASCAAASGRCAAEIAAMPDASRVVELVREWVTKR
jgi:UDP:flavonoid glycosyltransferase YjiC (YdhE family)